jgi:energy-coupling factor transport system ATP-binding protein
LRINICDLDFHYTKAPPLFRQLNINIPISKRIVITGNSGSGKTTLLKLIAGLLIPDSGTIRFEIQGKDRPAIQFGYLFQNPDNQFIHFNIERELAFNLENRGVPPTDMHTRVTDTLQEYRLLSRRTDSPNQLSGGEKQRLALAGMMISDPDVLLLDEPCSFLDIHAQLQLYSKIDELVSRGIGVIWIGQSPYELKMADHIIVLDAGRLLFCGSRSAYFQKDRILDEI